MLTLALTLLTASLAHPAPIVLHPGDHHDVVFTQDVTSAHSGAPKIVGATSPDERTVRVEAKALGKATVKVALVGAPERTLEIRVQPVPPVLPKLGSELVLEDEDEDGEAGHAAPERPDAAHFGGKLIRHARCDAPDEDETPDAVDAQIAQARKKLVEERGAAAAGAAENLLGALLKKSPTAARAYLYIGEAELRIGNDRAAAKAYETYLRSCPDTVAGQRVRGLLGTYREQLGKAHH